MSNLEFIHQNYKCPIFIYSCIILMGYINILLVVFEVCIGSSYERSLGNTLHFIPFQDKTAYNLTVFQIEEIEDLKDRNLKGNPGKITEYNNRLSEYSSFLCTVHCARIFSLQIQNLLFLSEILIERYLHDDVL